MVKSRGFEFLMEVDKEVTNLESADLLGEKSYSLLAVCVFSNLILLGLIKIGFIREKES